MIFKNKNITLDDNTGILTIQIELEPVKLGKDKKVCFFTSDVVDLLKSMGYSVGSPIKHDRVSNFRAPHIGEWKFSVKSAKKQTKIKKVEKQIESIEQQCESTTKNT